MPLSRLITFFPQSDIFKKRKKNVPRGTHTKKKKEFQQILATKKKIKKSSHNYKKNATFKQASEHTHKNKKQNEKRTKKTHG